jgi:D-beta-D-heptose 7-phosphate kinase/D-beta-D-heptose 1-phosphate adenosyltransferase
MHHSLMDSVYSLEELQGLVTEWHSRGEKVVFTNGCFDILHAGHVTYLQKAAQEGNRLIVAINTDRSVRELKGDSRPVAAQDDRACVVAALAAVDAVVFFDQSTPLSVIEALRPDVLVKGGDYSKQQVVGAPEVESWGGRVVLVPLVEGCRTSNLIKKIAG